MFSLSIITRASPAHYPIPDDLGTVTYTFQAYAQFTQRISDKWKALKRQWADGRVCDVSLTIDWSFLWVILLTARLGVSNDMARLLESGYTYVKGCSIVSPGIDVKHNQPINLVYIVYGTHTMYFHGTLDSLPVGSIT